MNVITNRLANEKSPYLLQHAHNPVDWYPWGDEAFEKARVEDKPVFLSIGYATCHWCHVMERESFENAEIAARMNEAFVCIKVDREERPDIDSIYMTVCQMVTGSGGWPLTIVMTPDKHPFYAATYIPPETRFGRTGMKEMIPRILDTWKNDRDKVLESAAQLTDLLHSQTSASSGRDLDPDLLKAGYAELMRQYDPKDGGFGLRPKFPTPHRLVFLLRQGEREGIAAAEHTLESMFRGGIFDQIGFGFHRYSTDSRWLLPHFEKMLYDQALLVIACTEAYERTGKERYAEMARKTLTYVLRDMTAPEGGFYSAEDADSEGEEGRFYTWTADEIRSIVGDDYEFIAKVWNLSPDGNYHEESTGAVSGRNIPHLSAPPAGGDAAQRISNARQKLFAAREKRVHPLKDTKVLADWNGLMIAALAKAGRALGCGEYTQAARQANRFIDSEMRLGNGELWHRWREGHRAVKGHLEDYAFMIHGLLELYETTGETPYLESALKYNEILQASFVDQAGGGYFMTADTAERLIVRPKELYDGAIPSGNSMQMLNLLRLARLTGQPEYERQAVETGRAFSDPMERSASSFAQALIALQFAAGESVEIVLVGRRDSEDTRRMREVIHAFHQPGRVVLFKDPAEEERLAKIAPFTKGMGMVDGKATVYLCRNFSCEQPINSLEELETRLK